MKMTLVILSLFVISVIEAQPSQKLWYQSPAEQWVEALPLGNGIIGAMVHGRTGKEELVWGLTETNVTYANPNREISGYGNPKFPGLDLNR